MTATHRDVSPDPFRDGPGGRSGAPARPAPAATERDLDFLYNPDPSAECCYRGVYRDGRGWQARAFKRRLGRKQANPRDAAKLVVRYWREHFGDRWREFFGLRQTQGWVYVPAAGGGWYARAHVVERPAGGPIRERVRLLASLGEVAVDAAEAVGATPFPTQAAVAAAVRHWAADEFGPLAPLTLRRSWTPRHADGRWTPVPPAG